jgi:hypothetical protein
MRYCNQHVAETFRRGERDHQNLLPARIFLRSYVPIKTDGFIMQNGCSSFLFTIEIQLPKTGTKQHNLD